MEVQCQRLAWPPNMGTLKRRPNAGKAGQNRSIGCAGDAEDGAALGPDLNFGPWRTGPRFDEAPSMGDHGSAECLLDGVDPRMDAPDVHFLDAVGVS